MTAVRKPRSRPALLANTVARNKCFNTFGAVNQGTVDLLVAMRANTGLNMDKLLFRLVTNAKART